MLDMIALPNVRAKLAPTVGRAGQVGENVQRTAYLARVARRLSSTSTNRSDGAAVQRPKADGPLRGHLHFTGPDQPGASPPGQNRVLTGEERRKYTGANNPARPGGTRYIFASPGLASCRCLPVSSNVRRHWAATVEVCFIRSFGKSKYKKRFGPCSDRKSVV